MFKKAKLYSLLAIIVASTVVGLFSFSDVVRADSGLSYSSQCSGVPTDCKITLSSSSDIHKEYGDDTSTIEFTFNPGINNVSEFREATGIPSGAIVFLDTTPPSTQLLAAQNSGWSNIYYVFYYNNIDTYNNKTNGRFLPVYVGKYNDNRQATPNTFEKKSNAVLVDSNNAGDVVDEEEKDAQTPPESDNEEREAAATIPSCDIKGVGWIVCPLVDFLAGVVDASYWMLEHTFLRLEPILLPGSSSDTGVDLYNSWKMMRDFANIIFIVGFLIIVFSQVTSFGVSNYGIKRLLPKIVIAAILVNISFFICAIAVDISNILGNGLRGLIESGSSGTPLNIKIGEDSLTSKAVTITSWTGLADSLLSGTFLPDSMSGMVGFGMTASIIYIFLPLFLPMLVTAAVSIAMVILVLTLRQALIIMLIVLSPLAFVALLLPNTETYFQKWRTLFMSMLLVYPVISVIFGASQLASQILMATNDFPTQLIGAGVSIIPLALTPIVMKASGGLLNRWAGVINDPTKGPIDGMRKGLANRGQLIKSGRVENQASTVRGSGGILGRAGSKRRRLYGALSYYGANQREKTMRDNLSAADSAMESTYLGSSEGQVARNAAENAKINVQNAQLKADTVRLNSVDGRAAQTESVAAEMRKQVAADRAQTEALNRLSPALASQAKDAELGKQVADNTVKVAGLAGANTDLKMQAITSSEQLSAAEGRDKQAYEEAAAGHIPVGTNPALAAAAQAARHELNTISQATDSAKRVGEQNYAKEIQNDPALAARAGGIDPYGKSRAESRAATTISKAFDEAVANEKSTMSTLNPADLSTIKNDTSQSAERRAAATGKLAQTGGASDVMDAWDELGSAMQSAISSAVTSEIEAVNAMQQQFMADIGGKIPGSITGPAKGAMSTGKYTGSVNTEIISSLGGGKYSGEILAGLHPKELEKINSVISTAKASGSLSATELAELSKLQASITEYKRVAPSLGKGIASEKESPISGIESI